MRTVAKRTPEAQAQIDAAKVMPGSANPPTVAEPAKSDDVRAAHGPVQGRPGIPGRLPGTTR